MRPHGVVGEAPIQYLWPKADLVMFTGKVGTVRLYVHSTMYSLSFTVNSYGRSRNSKLVHRGRRKHFFR